MVLGSNTSGHIFDTTFTADGVLYADANGVITSTAAGSAGQVLTSNGAGVAPTYQPAGSSAQSFLAILAADQNNVTGDGTSFQVPFDTVIFDTAGGFTTGASAHYTFPATGKWLITCGICYQPSPTSGGLFLNDFVLTGQTFRELTSLSPAASQFLTLGSTTVVSVTLGDTLLVNADNAGGTKTTNILSSSGTSLYLTFVSGHSIA